MDRSKLEKIVSTHIPGLVRFFDLYDWRVHYGYERHEGNVMARCTPDIDYKQAYISVDMDGMNDEIEVLDILFHEISHIILSPFNVYRNIVGQLIPNIVDGQPNGMVENRAWTHSCESAVVVLERIWRTTLRDIYLEEFTNPKED